MLPVVAIVLSPVSSLIVCNNPATLSPNNSIKKFANFCKSKFGNSGDVVTKLNNSSFVLKDFLTTKYLKKPVFCGPCQGSNPVSMQYFLIFIRLSSICLSNKPESFSKLSPIHQTPRLLKPSVNSSLSVLLILS